MNPTARPVWPPDWDGLSPCGRVRTVLAAITDGVVATRGQLLGLSEEKLAAVERSQPGPLGAAYRCWLSLAGGGAGHFLQGTDVYVPRLLELGHYALELFGDDGVDFRLGESDRAIAMHQGYQLTFLRGEGADPQVWYYEELDPRGRPWPVHARFTDWLRAMAEQQIPAWHRLLTR